jgi:ABC-type amino acid transport substrate-binding protein
MKAVYAGFLLGLLLQPWLAGALTLRFAPEADYGPFVFADAQGQARGLSVDLLEVLAPLGGFQIQTLPARSLHEHLAAAQRGEVDLLSSLRPTAERSRYLAFTEPYVVVPAVLVLPPGQARQQALQSLQGLPVGVGRGYAVEQFVRERYPAVQWLSFTDDHQALQAMGRGEIRGLVADMASLHFLTQRNANAPRYEIHQHIGFEYPLSFAYPLAREDIGERLRKALRALPPQTRQEIVQRWIPAGLNGYEDPRQSDLRLLSISCIAAGLLGLYLLRRSLRQQAQT